MARKLKILELCNLDRFAASPYMLPFFRMLAEKGHEVHVACRVTEFAGILGEAGLAVHDVPVTRTVTPFKDLKAYRRIKAVIREGGFDLVHTHNPKDGVMGRAAAWKLGVPAVIHTCNGFYFSHRTPSWKKRLVLAAERFAAKRCHLMIFVNSEDLALAAGKKIVGPGKAKLIPNGVDPERFHPGEDDGLREELGIPEGAAVIGYIGEIRRERNLDVLVEAAARVEAARAKATQGDLRLVMVGDSSIDPDEPARLEKLASGLGIEGRLIFAGHRLDPERFYRVMDVYALPSSREGFGVTVIEAMASGVPVVACRVRGPREIIEDGADGILVRDLDPRELADAVTIYLENPGTVKAHTGRAREKVVREYGLAGMHEALFSEYLRLTR